MQTLGKLIFIFCLGLASVASAADNDQYSLVYRIDFTNPAEKPKVSLTVNQKSGQLRSVRFKANPARFSNFKADAGLTQTGDEFFWSVPRKGGRLEWRAAITHERSDGKYDAKLADDWAVFRGEDVFPAMASIAQKGASSVAELKMQLPKSWSKATAFPEIVDGYRVDNPRRRFDRPTGWLAVGKLGIRRERIGDTSVYIAAPTNQSVRRQDLIALINWTLPSLRRLFTDFPEILLIVSANDPFWRGGLSGPGSLYIHADRPLISGNGTSTLVHELFHIGLGRRAAKNDDWIIEGLAEYYSVELLRRSGTTTESRNQKTMRSLAKWGGRAKRLSAKRSSGAITARAVGVFAAIDSEARSLSKNRKNLDDVVQELARKQGPLNQKELRTAFQRVTGSKSKLLASLAKESKSDSTKD